MKISLETAGQISFLHATFLSSLKQQFPAAALVASDGDLLVLHYQSLSDIGTLPAAAQTALQYFQLSPGDVILMNDPYSGGSVLSSVNLVMQLEDALLSVRIPFRPHVPLAQRVDQEGVRIPPTPIVQGGVSNIDILTAVAGHPLAPQNMKTVLLHSIDRMRTWHGSFHQALKLSGAPWGKKFFRDWTDLAEAQAELALTDLSEGDARVDTSFGGQSRLCVELNIHNQRVSFNFTGSTAPDQMALSDAATHGACVGALVSTMSKNVPITSGLLRRVDVIAPLGSNVHAKYPAPVFLGFTEGTSIIANLVVKLLGQIDRKLQSALSGVGRNSIALNFDDGKLYFEDVEPGRAARHESSGATALDPFHRTHLNRSVELSERLFPLRFVTIAVRSDSGGSGLWKGGDGMTKVIQLLSSAKLRWSQASTPLRPEGAGGGKSALLGEIQVVHKGSSIELETRGEMALESGDQIILKSGGGGGFGAPN